MMNGNSVKDWMMPDPITIGSSCTLPDAYGLMVNNGVRRLIVLDGLSLVGIIPLDEFLHAKPSTTFGFDFVRVSDQLCKMTIRQVLSKRLKTIISSAPLIDAACLMLEQKISTLPVIEPLFVQPNGCEILT